jgi:hypothetical protein
MRIHQSFVVSGILALSAVVSSSFTLTAQTVSTPSAVSPLTAQQQLRVRFHRLLLSTARSHSGWERGLWLRGPLLSADYAYRAALVRFLRTELVPYLTSERAVVYPVADIILGGSHDLTSPAISDSHVIEDFVERLDAAARSADGRAVQDNANALSVVVDNYFAKDHRLIQQLLTLGPRTEARRVSIAGR